MANRPSKGRDQQGPGVETTPHYPETTPPLSPSPDYTWVLETVMSMHNSMGKLTEAVDTLKSDQKEQGRKLDSISHKIYAGIVILTLIGAFIGVFGKSIAEAVINRLSAPSQQQTPPR